MPRSFDSLCVEWQDCFLDAARSQRLLLLKQFRDDFLCLPEFHNSLLADFSSVLRHRYPSLRIQDVYHHISSDIRSVLGDPPEPSDESRRLQDALLIDSQVRQFFRSIGPLDHGWRTWRETQIQRFHNEDSSFRESHIMYIPFAIELTQGCSGGCPFCGVSASYLDTSSSSSLDRFQPFKEFLLQMKDMHGNFGKSGVLYWASDPLDCPEYVDYAMIFKKVFDIWPSTTTALAEKYPIRFQKLLSTGILQRPWGVRCSLRNLNAYHKIKDSISLHDRFGIVFIPQFSASESTQANAGRHYSPTSENNEPQKGGTIACMSGLLVNLIQPRIELITPCLAEPHHQNGYRSLLRVEMDGLEQLSHYTANFISKLPILPIKMTDKLSVSIHSSQFHLYENKHCSGVLSLLSKTPLTLQQLKHTVSDDINQLSLFSYCLELMQHGVLHISN